MEQAGLHFPPLSLDVHREPGKILPKAGTIFSNPLDATNIVQPDIMHQAMKALG